MNKPVNMKQLAIAGTVIIALILVSATWTHVARSKKGSDQGANPRKVGDFPDPDRIPVDNAYIEAVGGFAGLSPKQQTWVRERLIHDLNYLLKEVGRRRLTYVSQGQEKHARECEHAMSLLRDAIKGASHPANDPTDCRGLIYDVVDALKR